METIASYLPDINYWAVICGFLVILNIYQYAKYHGTVGALSGELSHIKLFGHAPVGKVVVPATTVAVAAQPASDDATAHTLGLPIKGKGYL